MDTRELDRLGEVLGRAQEEALAGLGLERARARFLAPAAHAPRAPRLLWALPSAAAVAAAVVVLLALAPWRAAPLSFLVGEATAPGETGRWLAGAGAGLTLRFSDGSRVRIGPRASARVDRLDRQGASLLLEQGEAELEVTRRPGARWEVTAGPFRVTVVGTRFTVVWQPAARQFAVSLREGRVQVSGPLAEGRTMQAGERLTISIDRRQLTVQPLETISPLLPDAGPLSPDAQQTASGEPVERARPDAPAIPARKPSPRRRPRATPPKPARPAREPLPAFALAVKGRYSEAMNALAGAPWPGILEAGSADELQALGDAARLTGDVARTREVYGALRRRFPGSSMAALAAFSLGRVAFDQERRYAQAAEWFETYLREQPEGNLAQQSLGRLIEARSRSGELERAREAARRYLQRYPQGDHAGLARRLLETAARSPRNAP